MQNKLVESTSSFPLGETKGHRLFEVAAGEYAGRLVALMQTSGTDIKLCYSDSPYTSWSSPQTMITDSSDIPFDCLIEPNGDIHLAYSENSTNYLVARKLAFSGGTWSAGSKVTAYNGGTCFDPSIAREPSGKLWLSYARFSVPNRSLYIKSSTDGGASWGGAVDPGTELAGPSVNLVAKTMIGLNDIIVIYSIDLQRIAMRTLPLGGGSWTSEFVISGGSSISMRFDAAVRADGLLALVYDAFGLYYREYNGNVWTPATTIDTTPANSPTVFFRNNEPVIVYLSPFQGTQNLLKQTVRKSGLFASPVDLDRRARTFDAVVLYDDSSDTFQDRTSEAASSTIGDLYHSGSSCVVKDTGDQVFVGMEVPFRYIHFYLSTAGVGGTVNYSYWDGSQWNVFTPSGGMSHLETQNDRILLWDAYIGIPNDWQKSEVNSISRFWVRIEVVSSYGTGPVGSQVTAISEILKLVARR